jgi:hypothetical protein
MKVRSDSLFAKLTPAQREELLQRCVEEGLSLADGVALLRGWGVKSSPQGLSRLVSTQGFAWRLERAKAAAAATAAAPSFEQEKSRLLQQKIFEAVADANCPPKVLAVLRSLELEAEKVRLIEQKLELQERNLEHEKEKFKAALRTKLEAGLEVLYQEIKSNPKAVGIFSELQKTLAAKS